MIPATSILDKTRNFLWGSVPATHTGALRINQRREKQPDGPADILLIDVSYSMDEDDYKPTRLGGAIQAAGQFLEKRAMTDAFAMAGIVAFAGNARVVAPLLKVRTGLKTLRAALLNLTTESSTNIGAGLEEAAEALKEAQVGHRRIILLTDGHSITGRDPEEVASEIKECRVQLDIIGIGGSPEEVNEPVLKGMASIVKGERRYWFIRSAGELVQKFEALAIREIK